MNSNQQYEFLKTVGRLFDGTAAESDRVRFALQLAEDTEAQSVFMKYVAFDLDLEWLCGRDPEQEIVASESTKRLALRDDSSLNSLATTEPAKPRLTPLAILPQTNWFFSQSALCSISLVAICFYGTFLLMAWNLRPDRLPSVANGNDVTVAMMHMAADVHWSADTKPKANDSSIRAGESLKIEAGTIELELKAGAKLLVEGPAEWSVDADNSISLRSGKLLARVPAQAIGFTVETPTAEVVDLGTEFGVEVSKSGATDVQVLEGKVQVRPESQGQAIPNRTIILKAGSARRIAITQPGAAASVQEIAASPNRFVRQIPSTKSRRLFVRSARASSEWPTCEIHHLLDGSGMHGECHGAVATNAMWLSGPGKVKNEFLLFDFGEVCQVEKIKIWNYNDSFNGHNFYATRGVKQLDVYLSNTGKGDPLSRPDDWTLLIENRALHAANGTPQYASPDTIELGEIETRHLAIVIDDHLGPDSRSRALKYQSVGLSEVQFFGDHQVASRMNAP